MILNVSNIKKSFGDNEIITGGSFGINDHDKAAIVGINGAGKSTLLKMIVGMEEADSGDITTAKDITIGYLAQHTALDESSTIYEEVEKEKEYLIKMENRLRQMEENMSSVARDELESYMDEYHRLEDEFRSLDGYSYKSEITGIIKGLGFSESEFYTRCGQLSGGQKTRVSLAKLLVSEPDLIILDEPTNHLDIESISWLETYISNYKGTAIVVSHDRYFLDRIANTVVEIANKRISQYSGNYSDYITKSEERTKALQRAYENQQAKIEHEQAVIDKLKSFNREKSVKRAESRMKALERMEVIEKPLEVNAKMRFSFEIDDASGKDVLDCAGLSKAYGDKVLFNNISFEIKKGEKVAIIGANGTGKSTILKMINSLVDQDAGSVKIGTGVSIAYYDQEQENLDETKTIFEEISDDFPDLTDTYKRNVLAAFLFTGEEVFKSISALSGGERGRLMLAKLMLTRANFLILDEPTNHLDILSKEILEEQLQNYEGTVLYVSHDRYFINKTADRILNLTSESMVEFLGNYDYYLEKKDDLLKRFIADDRSADKGREISEQKQKGKDDWKKSKEEAALNKKRENRIKALEEEIDAKETESSEIEEEMSRPEVATNSAKLNELTGRLNEINTKLEALYEEWEELNS